MAGIVRGTVRAIILFAASTDLILFCPDNINNRATLLYIANSINVGRQAMQNSTRIIDLPGFVFAAQHIHIKAIEPHRQHPRNL